MANESSGSGILDLEKELTCSICTDILYQPLTLLDCLHTFCGGCLKEWFAWQATAAASSTSRRQAPHPYTCPQCRDSVRDTKADWRLTTLLEGFLKANPGKGKTAQEKDEMRQIYKPGDSVLSPVRVERQDGDSEDERLLAEVQQLSMTGVGPASARRRRERQRTRQAGTHSSHADRAPDEMERSVEHQPSLRSLLSGSEISSEDVQEEILQSIYSEGLLNGIDIDNLTTQQEEELTERIAEAYRRRQRHRERSRNRERDNGSGRSSRPSTRETDSTTSGPEPLQSSPPQQQASRTRPPIARPHLFEQAAPGAGRTERRSASSTSHHRRPSEGRAVSSDATAAARSATDLSQTRGSAGADHPRTRSRASSSNARSTTDPTDLRQDIERVRNAPTGHGTSAVHPRPRSRIRTVEPGRRQTNPPDSAMADATVRSSELANSTQVQQSIMRPAPSISGFAPEVNRTESTGTLRSPSLSCSRCERPNIEIKLHYNCGKCNDGDFNLCLQCYRGGRGCDHWFGFGFAALQRYERAAPLEGRTRVHDPPHVLTPRRYVLAASSTDSAQTAGNPTEAVLQEGAFCESCFAFANDSYWYCEICLEGAWGFCNACVLQGRHCTHPLFPLAHISSLRNHSHDPAKMAFLPVPHLKQHSYVLLPVLTDCDLCRLPIPPNNTRFHCCRCGENAGDYDICTTCYHNLVAQGKISHANGPHGWRRCLNGHRMSIVGYQDTPYGGAQVRTTLRDPVGGWRLKDDGSASAAPSSQTTAGSRCLALYSWFPAEENTDELAFPRNAEVREVEALNEDWSVGVYAARVGVFPSNHTRKL